SNILEGDNMTNSKRNDSFTRLGGLSHKNYLFKDCDKHYVLRLPNQHKKCSFAQEISIIKLLKPHHISPKFIYSREETGILISEFIADATVTEEVANDFDFITSLCSTLKTFHHLRCDFIFDPFNQIRSQIEQLNQSNFIFPDHFDELVQMLAELEPLLKTNVTYGLCHHDLNPSNILYKNHKVYLIDFEYAAMGDIFYDLATFCWLLSPKSQTYLLSTYFGYYDETIQEKLNHYLFVVKMWNMTWSYQKSLSSTSTYDFKIGGDFIAQDLISHYLN
ncbi:MAG: choline/ethanolamine kinase family protein, partial [Turicibacter sp.]